MCEDVRNTIIRKIDEKYGKLMLSVAHSVLNDYQEAEDVVQSVLWELISKHMDKLKGEKLKSYLCVAVRNAAIDLYRRKSRVVAEDPFLLNELTENRIDMDAFNNEYGFAAELQALLNELDYIDRDIVCMRYGWMHSYAEIAEAVNITEANARKRAERALKKLNVMILDEEVRR